MRSRTFSEEIATAFRAIEAPPSAAARMTMVARHRASHRPGLPYQPPRLRRRLLAAAAATLLAAGLAAGVVIWRSGEHGGSGTGGVVSTAPRPDANAPGGSAAIASGEPEINMSVAAARSKVGFRILLPDSLPEGYQLTGAFVPLGSSQVRVHFAGPQGEIVLLEEPNKDGPREPEGFEFTTSVNGYPALGVKGVVPPKPADPVSELQWWTGSMYFDLYGPVAYEQIEETATSVPQASQTPG